MREAAREEKLKIVQDLLGTSDWSNLLSATYRCALRASPREKMDSGGCEAELDDRRRSREAVLTLPS